MSKFIKSMLVVVCFIIVLTIISTSIFFLSFKTDYLDVVKIYANQFNVDTALIMSVIKAESKFNKNAISSANAVGLMQVRLETANYMLSKLGEGKISQTQLFNPQTNIKIGVKYLQYLLNRFNNLQVSICAYNAGETIVSSWLKDKKYSEDGIVLKQIPYSETSNYLKKVMINYQIYKKIIK